MNIKAEVIKQRKLHYGLSVVKLTTPTPHPLIYLQANLLMYEFDPTHYELRLYFSIPTAVMYIDPSRIVLANDYGSLSLGSTMPAISSTPDGL